MTSFNSITPLKTLHPVQSHLRSGVRTAACEFGETQFRPHQGPRCGEPGVLRPWHVGPELWPWVDGVEEGGRTPASPWHRGHPYPPPTPPSPRLSGRPETLGPPRRAENRVHGLHRGGEAYHEKVGGWSEWRGQHCGTDGLWCEVESAVRKPEPVAVTGWGRCRPWSHESDEPSVRPVQRGGTSEGRDQRGAGRHCAQARLLGMELLGIEMSCEHEGHGSQKLSTK